MNQSLTIQHFQQAFYYFALAVICLIIGCLIQGFAWLLVYPALSCVLVSSAYIRNNPAFLGKTFGSHSWFSIILFVPYLAGSWCSWRYYSSRIPAWMEIVPGILLGRRLTTGEAADLLHQGDVAVLDLAPEIAEISVFRGCTYQHVPILDLAPPSIPQLDAAVKFIKSPDHTNKIYIHCSLGLSRSSAVVAAFLLSEGADTDTAISLIRESRPEIIVSGAVQRVLKEFEAKRDSRETQVPWQGGFDTCRPPATVNKQSDPGHLSSAGKYILKVLS